MTLVDDCNADFIYVPDAFSPNRDGINDCFQILSPPRISEYKMLIFNRWGEKVFETFDENSCWNGTFKGKPSDPDVFVYHLKVKCVDGQENLIKGNITLLR